MRIARVLLSSLMFVTGLIVSTMQLAAYVLLRPISLSLFRTVNAQIAVLFWLQLIWLAEWWAKIDMQIFAPNQEVAQALEHEHKVILGNHRSDVDWLFGWVIAQKFGTLEGSKCLMKSSLLRVPGLGLSWWLSDFIFLSRNWEKDKDHLNKSTRALQHYPVPLCFMIYAEGTRMTPDKLKASQEFCRERGLPVLKNVMCPRTKGWNLVMKELRNAVDSVVTLTLEFPDVEPNLFTLLAGKPFRVHAYMERFPIDAIPKDAKASSEWCMSAFQRMDHVLEHHNKTGTFPGISINRPRSTKALVVMVAWMALIYGSILLYIAMCSQPLTAAITTAVIIGTVEAIIQVGTFLTSKMRKVKAAAKAKAKATHAAKKTE
ncbi:hypothetical protein PTSG_02252 [Salpingoeca rosetta]|uniref:Phospholipid/glycerol acyltransferase domain-containing protein n=1 Tax=Salpingoeca rosetta (strain ATCC 50818 / BSB-021) TaxID=946362 RepID=F2U1N1_SALR5|nr:uncharacterized protein PTSG_02252 [Salpingoeca rosetta]EGD81533.1 hypothetical protein PTSG_02252 [Salpingoeca rosetta]|eukprot:XP_004996737.1 hypothetical protein PTSG_02252 [Salpingoeca rosetta]